MPPTCRCIWTNSRSSSASIPVPSFSFLPSACSWGTVPHWFSGSALPGARWRVPGKICVWHFVTPHSHRQYLLETIFQRARPAYCPPTRDVVFSHLLNCEYDRVQSQVHEAIGKADFVTVICSGWSDIKQTGTIIYVVATPVPLFYKQTMTKEQTHMSTCIAEELKHIINEVGAQNIFDVVTNDIPGNLAALGSSRVSKLTSVWCPAALWWRRCHAVNEGSVQESWAGGQVC